MIQWVLRSYVDTDALFTLRNKLQFLVEKNVLKCRHLLLRHIYDSNFRNSLVDMVGDLLHGALVVLNMDSRPPGFVKVYQKAGHHVAGICRQPQTVLLIRHGQRGDRSRCSQNQLRILQHVLSINRRLYAFPAPDQKGPPQFML